MFLFSRFNFHFYAILTEWAQKCTDIPKNAYFSDGVKFKIINTDPCSDTEFSVPRNVFLYWILSPT